jgi:hypothetical protein
MFSAPRRSFAPPPRLALVLVLLLLWAPGAGLAQRPSQPTPWRGTDGITETTAAIMARAEGYQRLATEAEEEPRHLPRGRMSPEKLFQDPNATGGSSFGGGAPTPLAAQTGVLNFTGATLADTASFPPDSMGAAGPAQYLVAVNGRIRSFDKTTGLADSVLNANPDAFFATVMTPPVSQNFTSDPRIRYDRLTGRWFIIIIDVPGAQGLLPNRVLLAVSSAPVITPATTWTFFYFQHDLVTPTSKTDTGNFADYPTLGIDAQALYIGVNVFGGRRGSFINTTAFLIRKTSILGNGPIVVTPFRDLIGNGTQGGPYTPQGVDNPDPSATEGYLIGVDNSYYGRLSLRRISNLGGSPTISGNLAITTAATGPTIDVQHLGNTGGTSGQLDGLDRRLLAAQMRNGHLWTTANLAVDNTGSPSGTDTRMAVRWYELSGIPTGQTPAVVQYGTLYQPSASNDTAQRAYWMGTIAVSGQGHALMGFSVAGAAERANAGYAGRLATDPTGTLRTPVLYTSSTGSYNPPSDPGGSSGRRWGDYSYTCVDPSDDMTMWTIQEWCNADNSYAVQILKVLGPPPATPIAANPASLGPGQSNVSVTITGSSTDGSGFFDPGTGFSNRIAAAVLGGGILVNSVTYANPTSVTLNLSVLSSATAGNRLVRITNPDGQVSTSATGLLAIGSGQSTNQPPVLTPIASQVVTETTLLTFQASATDPEGTPLTFTLDSGSPAGATLNPTNGVFSWVPDEAQGPSTNTITLRVTDSGSPPQSAAQSFTVTVLESNLPPVLAPVQGLTVHAGTLLTVTNSATDADLPANHLSFTLLPTSPAGAAIDSQTGVLTWLTTSADAFSTNTFNIRVTDDGTPVLGDTNSFSVVVLPLPVLGGLALVDNAVQMTWSSIPGAAYLIQYKTNLNDTVWIDMTPAVLAIGPSTSFTNSSPPGEAIFYRLQVQP